MKACLLIVQLFFIFPGALLLCHSANGQQKIPNIIFETDMGNDVDDALALDMIYKYLDRHSIHLLAVCSNKQNPFSTEYIHLLNNWYGYPNTPIGRVMNGLNSEGESRNYAEYVCRLKNGKGEALFSRPAFRYDSVPDAVQLYRKLLAGQSDSSVTIVSVGFSTNIARLLQSAPDAFSPLSGRELVARKVKLLSVMGGSFGEKPIAEYNIKKDIPAARLLARDWPGPVLYAPFEAGMQVLYPAGSIEKDFQWTRAHPVVEAYKYYLEMPYDRPCWDLLAVLYAVEGDSLYFTQSSWGRVQVDDMGNTAFTPDKKGSRAYLMVNQRQAAAILNRIIQLTTARPGRFPLNKAGK